MATDTRFRLPALDGFPLSVHRFDPAPSSSGVKAVCIIVNATGVAAQFYRSFAKHLSTKGVAVCTFDYRYSGQSFPPERLRKLQSVTPGTEEFDDAFHEALLECKAEWGLMSHWCRQDLAAMVHFARQTWPGLPLTLLGNSLGAHLSTLLEEHTLFPSSDAASSTTPAPTVRILNVCGGNAYWENNNSPEEAKFVFDQMIKMPLQTEGVFRSSSLGLGYDLPYGAGVDWLKWFYHPLFSLQGVEDESIARALGERLDKYLYVGFEDDATINRLMQANHLSLFSHKRKNFHSLWIDPPKCEPPWPAMGHVTSFIPTRKDSSAAQASETETGAETGAEERPGGPATEAYEPTETDVAAASPSPVPSSSLSSPLTREETIFPLYLDYILHGTVPEAAPGREHRVWTVADERDRGELRRGWEQALKLERIGEEREKKREREETEKQQQQGREKDKARL
jgi:predicted alpha/beta hydrolase